MNKDDIAMKCIRCGHSQRVLSMVMDASKRGMICRPCAGLQPGARVKMAAKVAPTPPSRRKVRCKDCSYSFATSKAAGGIVCGYCGSSNINDREDSAEDLLRSVKHIRE